MKTLKEILQLEVYEPKSPDEKRFKDKHVVVKHEDANGNKDDLFNAKNIKTVNREPRHGYNPGEDEKVYEEIEELDERVTRKLSPKEQGKIAKVMREFSAGNLKDSHGKTVTDKKQALAIAYSQMNESSLRAIKQEFAKTMVGGGEYGTEGVIAKRETLKSAAAMNRAMKKVAPKKEEESTHNRMMKKLKVDPENPVSGRIGKKK